MHRRAHEMRGLIVASLIFGAVRVGGQALDAYEARAPRPARVFPIEGEAERARNRQAPPLRPFDWDDGGGSVAAVQTTSLYTAGAYAGPGTFAVTGEPAAGGRLAATPPGPRHAAHPAEAAEVDAAAARRAPTAYVSDAARAAPLARGAHDWAEGVVLRPNLLAGAHKLRGQPEDWPIPSAARPDPLGRTVSLRAPRTVAVDAPRSALETWDEAST